MKYYGTFSANGGTTITRQPYESTNKNAINADMRDIALANKILGNDCAREVTDEKGKTVFSGRYWPGTGIRYEVKNYKYMY